MNRQRRPRHLRLSVLATAAAGVALALTAVTACGSAASSGAPAPGASSAGASSAGAGAASSSPITIGMSLPMTGPVADVSKAGYQGYELWAAQVNAAGGLLGRKVRLTLLDDGFDPGQTTSDYTRLISQDHVDLLLGTFSSLLNAPASAVAARQGMLYVEPSGGAATLFTRGFTNLFFAQPGTTTTLPDRFVAWIASLPASARPATAAYVTQDDPSASPAVAVFRTRLQALGVKTVYYQVYDPTTTNFGSIAASIAAARPQMIVQGAVAEDGAQFVRSLQQLRFSPKILFQTNAPTDATFPGAVGGAANASGIFTAQSWSATAAYPGNASFVAAYQKMFGTHPTEDAANSYTAGQVLAAAVRAVGRIDQKALAGWLHTHTVPTIVGPLTWNSAGDPEGSLLLSQWQDGILQVVAPASAATARTVVNPKPAWGNG